MAIIPVRTTDKHFDNTYTTLPVITALKEIIFNSLDADATKIDIFIKPNSLNTDIEEFVVKDNGTGIPYPDSTAENDTFAFLGQSTKAIGQTNKFNRLMHGKKGEGRFKGFSLGNLLLWESKTKTSSHVIKLNIKDPQNLDVEKKDVTELAEYETGTIFRAFPNGKRLNFQIPKGRKIDLEKIINDITSSLEGSFLTVLQDKNISLTLNNKKLSVSNYIEQQTDNKLPEPNSDVTVKTIIWNKSSVDNNRIFWCDRDFNTLLEDRLDDTKEKTNNSIYIASDRIAQAYNDNTLTLNGLSQDINEIKKQAKEINQSVLISYKKNSANDIIAYLKDEEIYPYETDPETATQKRCQDIFDAVVIKLNEKRPILFKKNKKQIQQNVINTLKVIIERDPQNFGLILTNLAGLSPEEVEEFAELIKRVSLSSIIKTSSTIMDRLGFIESLKQIAYRNFNNIKERAHLHKILEREAWIFGEQFNLTHSDKSFNTIIGSIRNKIESFVQEDVEGNDRIPDLFFTTKHFIGDKPHALIVELKRPSCTIGKKEIQQIKDYYDIVRNNTEFANYIIDLVIVSSETGDNVKSELMPNSKDMLNYCQNTPDKRLFVRRWCDIIDSNESSLAKLKECLDADIGPEDGTDYLMKKHGDILSKNTK